MCTKTEQQQHSQISRNIESCKRKVCFEFCCHHLVPLLHSIQKSTPRVVLIQLMLATLVSSTFTAHNAHSSTSKKQNYQRSPLKFHPNNRTLTVIIATRIIFPIARPNFWIVSTNALLLKNNPAHPFVTNFSLFDHTRGSRVGVVGIATRCGLDVRFRIPKRARKFLFSKNVQTRPVLGPTKLTLHFSAARR